MLGTASPDGFFTRLNPAWEQTLGWTIEELMAQPFVAFVHPDDVDSTVKQTNKLDQGKAVIDFENRYRDRDGEYHWIQWTTTSEDGVIYFVARDVTARKTAETDRHKAASVTRAIIESVADGLYVADASGELTFINPAGVALLGYDSAAELIGRNGHEAFHHSRPNGAHYPSADCPLAAVRVTGQAIHVAEDTFWDKHGSSMPVSYSSAPIELDGNTGYVVAFRDLTARKAAELLERREEEALGWAGRIRDALDGDRLVLYAQPIVEVATGKTVSHELLVRMIAPNGDVIPPGAFLPVAESRGLIGAIDRRVIELACGYAARHHPIALNLSADSISDPSLFRFVESQIKSQNVDPSLVVLEITETALMHNEKVAKAFIENVRRLGCEVALDDFGTGYGSFRYLKNLPVSLLKIDQEFVLDLDGDAPRVNQHVVEAVVMLARGMGQKTVAEGVETQAALDQLELLGVDYAQGYLLAHPASAEDVFKQIERELVAA